MNHFMLLTQVNALIEKHDEIVKITGENFNIFSIQQMESNEVYTHSAFLGELLNPNGTHGLREIPLKLFLTEIKRYYEKELKENNLLDKFEIKTSEAKIKVEKFIGHIDEDYTKGGRIDIFIEDKISNKKI